MKWYLLIRKDVHDPLLSEKQKITEQFIQCQPIFVKNIFA